MKKILLVLFLFLGFNGEALAHKVVVFAWIEDGVVHVNGGFGGSRKAKNCTVIISDPDGKELLSGKTDENGELSVPIPPGIDSDIRVTLDAGPGHQGVWVISRQEILALESPDSVKTNAIKGSGSFPLVRVLAGIGIIFCLALILSRIKQKKGS